MWNIENIRICRLRRIGAMRSQIAGSLTMFLMAFFIRLEGVKSTVKACLFLLFQINQKRFTPVEEVVYVKH